VVSRTGWQLLIGPDDFAVRDVAGSPSAGQSGDEEEAAAVFVGGAGVSHKGVAVAGVGDFAGQHLVSDEAKADRAVVVAVAVAVDDGVGEQFADDQLCGLG
jgi:hypothetical protein